MPANTIQYAHAESKILIIQPPDWNQATGYFAEIRVFLGPGTEFLTATAETIPGGRAFIRCEALFSSGPRGGIPLPLEIGDIVEFALEGADVRVLAVKKGQSIVEPTASFTNMPTDSLHDADNAIPAAEQNLATETLIELSSKFVDYLAGRKSRRVDLSEKQGWHQGAHDAAAGARNPAGSIIAPSGAAIKATVLAFNELISFLRDEQIAGQTSFDRAFFDSLSICLRRANPSDDKNLFTFGRAQKFLTLSLKYCYAWWFARKLPSPLYGNLDWVERWAPFIHIPVDEYTLKHLAAFDAFKHITSIGYRTLSWKWHLSEPRYCRIQDAIRTLALKTGVDPLHYEMSRIWVRSESGSGDK